MVFVVRICNHGVRDIPYPLFSGQQSSRPLGGITDESVKAYKDMNTFLASFIDHVSN